MMRLLSENGEMRGKPISFSRKQIRLNFEGLGTQGMKIDIKTGNGGVVVV